MADFILEILGGSSSKGLKVAKYGNLFQRWLIGKPGVYSATFQEKIKAASGGLIKLHGPMIVKWKHNDDLKKVKLPAEYETQLVDAFKTYIEKKDQGVLASFLAKNADAVVAEPEEVA